MPLKPPRNVADATVTAWSEAVPVPNACMIIMPLPNRRGMKKSLTCFTRRAIQTPSAVMPTR